MSDQYDELGKRVVARPHMQRILNAANQDHEGFRMWLTDVLRAEGVYQLPSSIVEALNSGDGVYRP